MFTPHKSNQVHLEIGKICHFKFFLVEVAFYYCDNISRLQIRKYEFVEKANKMSIILLLENNLFKLYF